MICNTLLHWALSGRFSVRDSCPRFLLQKCGPEKRAAKARPDCRVLAKSARLELPGFWPLQNSILEPHGRVMSVLQASFILALNLQFETGNFRQAVVEFHSAGDLQRFIGAP